MITRPGGAVEFASEDTSAWGELKLISGSANAALADEIGSELAVRLTDPGIKRFPDGEIYAQIQDSMRGHDVFVVQPTCQPVNESLMELFIILDALRRASAGRVTAVIPYYGYARQERKLHPREPISAKLVANIITLAGADRLLVLDLHESAAEGFFDVPTDHLTAAKLIAEHLRGQDLPKLTVIAPDAGGAKRAEALANLLQAPIAFGYKRRESSEEVEVLEVAGEVAGRDCVVVEDIISTGRTIVGLAGSLRRLGARRVVVCAYHPVLTAGAVERLRSSPIDDVIVTNTIPIPPESQGPPISVLSVAPLLAQAILRVHENRSVSELFRG